MATNRRVKFKDNKDFVYVVPFIPIGYIFETTNPDNPNTYYGGTWEYFGRGKVMVGYDPNDDDFNTIEKVGGEKSHTLNINEMPAHSHGLSSAARTWDDARVNSGDIMGAKNTTTKIVYFNSGITGGNQSHNNLQPYIVVYRWRKIAY